MNKTNYYFNAFSEIAGYGVRIAEELQETLNHYGSIDLQAKTRAMHDLEHEADMLLQSLMDKLTDEFIPPLEREDIVALAQELDNVVDNIESLFQKLYMYNINQLRPDTLGFSEIILRLTKALKSLLDEFPNFKKPARLKQLIAEIIALEESGDRLYLEAMHQLYRGETDPICINSWTTIYDRLEKCCDSVEHVADIVETVILKNS